MSSVLRSPQPRNCIVFTVMMITCLILLINTSFKIIVIADMTFTVSGVLCPLVACCYLMLLKKCSLGQQRHSLNLSLFALYLFSIGAYLLVNLPSADFMREGMAYQIVFEDIPKKFFAATLAFGLSFYLPHYLCSQTQILASVRKQLLLALLGGFVFFSLDFLLLFSDKGLPSIRHIYFDSLMVAVGIMMLAGVLYLSYLLFGRNFSKANLRLVPSPTYSYWLSPYYHYLIGFSVIIILICLACEYRLLSLGHHTIFAASGILSPLLLLTNNIVGEFFGYKANIWLVVALVFSQIIFDVLLITAIILPSPDYFDLNPFYLFIMPRRIPATTFILLISYCCNALLIELLKPSIINRKWRLLIANALSITLLCSICYNLLYADVYSHEQIFNLTVNAWIYRMLFALISLPLINWIGNCRLGRAT